MAALNSVYNRLQLPLFSRSGSYIRRRAPTSKVFLEYSHRIIPGQYWMSAYSVTLSDDRAEPEELNMRGLSSELFPVVQLIAYLHTCYSNSLFCQLFDAI